MARKGLIETFIEIIVLAVFLPIMFWIGFLTGFGYVLAIVFAVRSRILFRRKRVARLIISGTLLSTLAAFLLFWAIDMRAVGHATSAGIIFLVALVVWWKGYRLKRGRR